MSSEVNICYIQTFVSLLKVYQLLNLSLFARADFYIFFMLCLTYFIC